MQSVEELLGLDQPKNSDDKKKGNRFTMIRSKTMLYMKELKYPIALTVALVGLGVGANYTLLNTESQFSMQNMYGTGKEQLTTMEENSVKLVKSTASSRGELEQLNVQISQKKAELDDANATITNLTQGYYFIAYLDSLFDKHNITLDKFDINLQGTQIGDQLGSGKVLTLNNLVDMQIPKGDYSLLPIDIEFTTSSESLRLLFDEFYTRRIVYDKDLRVINNFDNSVTVSTKIEFVKATITDELVPQEPTEGTEVVDPALDGLSTGGNVDPWATTPNTGTDPNAGANTGTTTDTNAGVVNTNPVENGLYQNTTPSAQDVSGQ